MCVCVCIIYSFSPAELSRRWSRRKGGAGRGVVKAGKEWGAEISAAIPFFLKRVGGASLSALTSSIYGPATWVAIFMSDCLILSEQHQGLAIALMWSVEEKDAHTLC